MAFVNQEIKKKLAPNIKNVLKKYNVKGSISVNNLSTIVVTLSSGELDLLGVRKNTLLEKNQYSVEDLENLTYFDVNHYWIDRDYNDGNVVSFLSELKHAMLGEDYYDNTDVQSDYFDCSHYIRISVGKYNKPYEHQI
jgi:hypothetical protein